MFDWIMVGGTPKVQFLAGVLLSKSICICSYPPSVYSVGTGSCLLERLVVGVSPPLLHMVLSASPLVAFMTWFADGKISPIPAVGMSVVEEGYFACIYMCAVCWVSLLVWTLLCKHSEYLTASWLEHNCPFSMKSAQACLAVTRAN